MARASSAHAVVIGASMAGLVAARAAARHFDQVTVLERQPEPEPGTSIAAQGRMAHAMLQSGSDGLETMFPGIKDELIGAGAIPFTPLVGGAPIRLDDQGTGNPTLFLHGNPESAESWAGVVERLAPAMRCLVPDLPGFGRSAVPETFEASPAGVGAFTAALLDAAGVGEPVDVVAHDFGGAFGLSLAIDHPERVRRLVLVSTPAYVQDFPLHPDARRWRTPVVGEVSLALMNEPGMRYALRKANPRITDEQVRAMYRRITPVTKQMILRLYRGFSPEEWGSWERRMLARTASLPTMVIQGDDPYIPDWVADRFGARRVAHLRGYGHFLPLEAPEQLAQEIASFLAAGEDAAAPTAAATS